MSTAADPAACLGVSVCPSVTRGAPHGGGRSTPTPKLSIPGGRRQRGRFWGGGDAGREPRCGAGRGPGAGAGAGAGAVPVPAVGPGRDAAGPVPGTMLGGALALLCALSLCPPVLAAPEPGSGLDTGRTGGRGSWGVPGGLSGAGASRAGMRAVPSGMRWRAGERERGSAGTPGALRGCGGGSWPWG